jgi:signal transduction histidine kinase
VLRYIATAPARLAAIERQIGRPVRGLAAHPGAWESFREVVQDRQTLYREEVDVLIGFLLRATGHDVTSLDSAPDTAGVGNGVLAPLYVHDQPWGMLVVASETLTRADAPAVALFATHVGSALEVAETIEALQRTNRELQECYRDLAQAQAELVEHERLAALGELAAVVAHEVRNPLGVLYNSISSLQRMLERYVTGGPSPGIAADAQGLLCIAAEESSRLDRLVSDLLDFARPFQPHLAATAVADVVKEAIAATSCEDRVCFESSAELPLVQMDAALMRQALLNLLLNGLQAMPRGTLAVCTGVEQAESGAVARIDVTDSGPGIPAEHQQRIFEPFFTTKAAGTGLGLAVVRRIMESHGGEVAVVTRPGSTTFSLRLPVQAG